MNSAMIAILYGLGGAIGWGASNFFAAKSTREKNVVLTVFNSQLLLFLAMGVIALVLKPEVHISPEMLAFIAFNYLIFTVGLVISYKAYAMGPVSVTAPIVGANSLVVVVVSVLFLNEVLQRNQWLGIALLFLGLIVASQERRRRERKIHLKTSGIFLAFIALLLIGLGIAGFVYAIGEIGWEMAVLLGYFFPALWSGLYLLAKKQLKTPRISKSIAGLTAFQLLGTVSVSVGVEKSLAALVVPVSSVSPLITSILGLILFQEKTAKYKLVGAALIILGLVLISI